MRKLWSVFALTMVLLTTVSVAQAQSSSSSRRPTAGYDRLFLGFIQDATVIDRQWWEGQFEFSDSDSIDLNVVRGIVALQPWQDVEVGARVGFGSSDTPSGFPDGSGGTDLDLWGKYYLGGQGRSDAEFALGGIVTVPTGDDTAGLGTDAFSLAGFGAGRLRLDRVIVTGHAGLRFTEDGKIFGTDLEGETSVFGGAGVIVPFSDRVTVVGELTVEGDRFEGADTDFRALGGINWRSTNRGMIRGAVAVGLSDGAPDAQLLLGYASRF